MGKWPTVISLIHPEGELSFKEMRMCSQSKNSSFFVIGVNQEKWKAGGVQDFVVVVVCQNLQVNGPNKFKHDLSDSLHYSLFYPVLLHCVMYRSACK